MHIFMASAAALALAATGAYAQGNGNGNGNGNGKANQAAQNKGNGKDNGNRADRGPRSVGQSTARDNGNRGNAPARMDRDRGPDRIDRDRFERRDIGNGNRGNGNPRNPDVSVRYDDRGTVRSGERDYRWLAQDRNRSLIDGCPPGLAKKRNGCNPPGQVRNRDSRSVFGTAYGPGLFGLSAYDRRGDYYYRDGYLVRYGDRGGIASWLPLLGGALGIGNLWPSNYRSYDVPDYYVDFYDLGGQDRYRYADNVLYRVDPEDAAITSIAALLTGDQITVGQPMPRGYDVYNVPLAYRDRYYDTPDRYYRYSDGYVYQVDPETRLVAAAIDLLM